MFQFVNHFVFAEEHAKRRNNAIAQQLLCYHYCSKGIGIV